MARKCPKCQHENPDDTLYCGKCATPLKSAEEISITKTLTSPTERLQKGKTIAGKYKILAEIGRGGMGVVFKAKDKRLDRFVALKFLPPELTRDTEAKKRFIQEAKAAAALNHPQICTIYEVDEVDNQSFISMEYIEGQNLKDKLKSSQLEIDEAQNIIIQVAEGLKEAHEKGIVHRDIKPSNIILNHKGAAKIMDFGIAKLKTGEDLTKASTLIGTVAYMSPEQARGEAVDQRSDIWSLGIVLYEITTGCLPFKGEYEATILYSVLNDEIKPVKRIRKDVPPHMEKVICKCLEKNPDNRYQNLNEVLEDLKRPVKSLAAEKGKNSIAVLPFENMSSDVEQEYFCDGLTEELINALTHIQNLKVIARTSAFMFKGKHEDIREIGKKLDVEHLLEGSVRRAGNKLRITAQLIKVYDGSHLWSEKYDRKMEDVFIIQDEISLAIVDNLKVRLLGEEREALLKHSTTNEYAYNLYLQGRFYWNKLTLNDLENAVNCFNKAIESDPDFALAYFGLADTYWMLHQVVPLPADEAMPKTKDAALKALEIDNTLAEAYAIVGAVIYMYEWKWSEAEECFKKAYNLNPRSGPVKMYYSSFLQYTDRKSEAIQMMEETLETDPYSLIFHVNVAIRLYIAERYDEAIQKCEALLRMEPNWYPAYYFIGRSYICKGMYDKAEQKLVKANELFAGIPESLPILGYVYATQGKNNEARNIISVLHKESKKTYIPMFYYAYVYKGLGEIDKTFEYIEKAIEERDPRVAWWIRYIPFKNLRSDRRYADVIRKLGMDFLEKELMEQFPLEKTKPSIIVLPFEDMSPDKDNAYFSDGLTEEIIADLSKIHSLSVISRTSAMMYKGTRKAMKTISRELGIQYALEGSVRKAGNKLRITAQLIDAKNDLHLWAEKYNGTLDDVFEIQENVSHSIVDMLKIKLTPQEEKMFGRSSIDNPQVYDWYLRAWNLIWAFTESSLDNALSLAEQGLELIGDNDLLLTVQGFVYFQYVNALCKDPDEYPDFLEKARKNAEKALELNPYCANAHYLLHGISTNTADPHKSVYHNQRSLQLDPNHVESLYCMGIIRTTGGWDIDGASKYFERAAKLDPFPGYIKSGLGWIYWFKGAFQKAVDEFQAWQKDLEANSSPMQIFIAWVNTYAGNHKEAFRLIDKLIDENPNHLHAATAAALKYALQGEKKKAKDAITEKLKKAVWWDDAWPLLMADIYAILGEDELVFHWLERAIDSGIANVNFLMSNPFMTNLHSKKKFQMLIEKANRLSEALKKTAEASVNEDFTL